MNLRLVVTCVVAFAISAVRAQAEGPAVYPDQPAQAPACTCVEHSCKLVPDVKQIKKTVYEVQEVPYCLKKLPPLWSLFCHHDCDCEVCPDCKCPRYKKVMVKKEIVCKEICTTKCVIEEHRVRCQPCETNCK